MMAGESTFGKDPDRLKQLFSVGLDDGEAESEVVKKHAVVSDLVGVKFLTGGFNGFFGTDHGEAGWPHQSVQIARCLG